MAIPHPFKTVRRAGTPSTGGSVMTLQSHVASPTAHPIYQKKGDAVGNVSLAEHNNDVGAHRVHYLRRLELATSLDDYDASKVIDPSYYSGSNPTDISNIWKTIPTTYLLELIFANPDKYIPKLLKKDNIIDDVTHVASDVKEAPSWSLFKTMYDLVASFQISGSGNPLANIFALKDHRHDGVYSESGHMHRITDIVDVYGNVSVAAVNHDHDDRYWLRAEVLDTVFDPSVLRQTGIWPLMPYFKTVDPEVSRVKSAEYQEDLDLNLYGTQGNYSFHIDAAKVSLEGYNYPDSVADAMDKHYTSTGDKASDISTDNSLEQTAVLAVLSNNAEPFNFSSDRAIDYLNTDPSKSVTYRVVNQMLSVNVPIKKYDRVALGTSVTKAVEQYKDSVAGIFWRTGYSLETAWYIDGVLKIAGLTPSSMMGLVNSGDPVTAIAEHIESALDRKMNQSSSSSGDGSSSDTWDTSISYVTAGYYHPDVGIASLEVVRATKFAAAIGQSRSGTLAQTVETSNVNIVHHDSTNWTIPNKVNLGSAMTAEAASSKFDEMQAFFLYSTLLPYRNYYITTSSERILSYPANDSIEMTGTRLNDEYTYKSGSASLPYSRDVSRFDLKSNDGDIDSLVTSEGAIIAYPDEELISGERPFPLLAEYRKCIEGTVYLDGVNYYETDGTHNGTVMPKMKLKTHVVGAVITGDVYRKVMVVDALGNGRRMLRPMVQEEYYNTSIDSNYYVYNSDTHVFSRFSPAESYFDPTVPGAVQVYTPYSIYRVSYTDTKLELEEGDLLPLTVNNSPLLAGVTYKFFETAVPYDSATETYQFPDGGITIIPRVPEYAGTDDAEDIKTDEYKYYTLSGSTYTPITGEVVPSSNLYRLPIDTEGTKYVVAGTKVSVPTTGGVAEVHYGVSNLKYQTNTVDLNKVRCKAFFFETHDNSFVEYKKYFSKGEGKDYILVTDRTGDPSAKGLYEIIDVEDYFNVAAAIIQLTTVGANATVNSKKLIYTIDSSGRLVTWDDWQRLITERNIDATMKSLGVVYNDDPLWTALGTANANYSIANTFAKAKLLSSTVEDNISALNRLGVSGTNQNTRLYDTIKDSGLAYLSDLTSYVKKTDGTESPAANARKDDSYSKTLDRVDALETYKTNHENAHGGNTGFDAKLANVINTVGNSESGLVRSYNDLRAEIGASTNQVSGKTIYSRVQALEEAGGLSVAVIDTVVELSSAAAGDDVKVLTLSSGEYENFIYSVVLRDNTRNITIPCPTAEIADPRHTGYVPVYVNASSLIFIKSDGVYLHVPNSWLDIYGGGNDLSVYIRRIPVAQETG